MAVSSSRIQKDFEKLRQRIQEKVEEGESPLDPKGSGKRRKEVAGDLYAFMQCYLPHYFVKEPSLFHKELITSLEPLLSNRLGPLRLAVAAPRGNGKTTLLRALVLYLICMEKRRFVFWASDSLDQAKDSLEAIKAELEDNPRLRIDFNHIVGVGALWNQEEIITNNRIKVKVVGTRKRIRGQNFGNQRPDLVILDDLENDEEVLNPELREKSQDWFFKSVLPLGPPDGSMDLLMVGTVMHHDSLLSRVLRHPGFEGLKFRALIEYPKRMDLWDRFEALYHQEGKNEAHGFYREHQVLMEEGAKCLWPDVQPLLTLMERRALSQRSFESEYQNEPIDEAERIFDVIHTYESSPERLTCYAAVDPSLGMSGNKGDYSAIVILGRAEDGRVYVLEARLMRVKPHQLLEEILALQAQYDCRLWAVEEVQFQAFFKDELVRLSTERGRPLPVKGVRPQKNKILRIGALESFVRNGVILFRADQSLLLEQMRRFPMADHDDGPDALEMAFRLAERARPEVIRSQRPDMNRNLQFQGY